MYMCVCVCVCVCVYVRVCVSLIMLCCTPSVFSNMSFLFSPSSFSLLPSFPRETVDVGSNMRAQAVHREHLELDRERLRAEKAANPVSLIIANDFTGAAEGGEKEKKKKKKERDPQTQKAIDTMRARGDLDKNMGKYAIREREKNVDGFSVSKGAHHTNQALEADAALDRVRQTRERLKNRSANMKTFDVAQRRHSTTPNVGGQGGGGGGGGRGNAAFNRRASQRLKAEKLVAMMESSDRKSMMMLHGDNGFFAQGAGGGRPGLGRRTSSGSTEDGIDEDEEYGAEGGGGERKSKSKSRMGRSRRLSATMDQAPSELKTKKKEKKKEGRSRRRSTLGESPSAKQKGGKLSSLLVPL